MSPQEMVCKVQEKAEECGIGIDSAMGSAEWGEISRVSIKTRGVNPLARFKRLDDHFGGFSCRKQELGGGEVGAFQQATERLRFCE
jgi:hypothetical protein